ncbi:hypothetical protein [Helicobacter mesocricetorum]|uniref:hypothetical protein n=1 Tax=Helicobacter mesocricetorum TaxID=87012 RepID=UPI000CF11557|nr:hypothetical protein [Helicobacter mesocricetorum]
MGGGYIVWDSDILPLQKIDFFSISKDCKNTTEFKALFNYGTETHKPYFRTMQTLLPDLKKRVNVSFIAEYMPIDAVKMCELLDNIEMAHKKPFWQAILESISLEDLAFSGFSEFETYGNFLALYYPQSFSFKKRRYDRFAKEIIGANPSSRQLKWYGKYYEIIGFESWSKTNTMALKLSKNPFICAIFSPKGLRKLLKIKYKPF